MRQLMYSPLSQKNLYNCALTSNRKNNSQSFLRCFSWVAKFYIQQLCSNLKKKKSFKNISKNEVRVLYIILLSFFFSLSLGATLHLLSTCSAPAQ